MISGGKEEIPRAYTGMRLTANGKREEPPQAFTGMPRKAPTQPTTRALD
jgi:hypothetical protein